MYTAETDRLFLRELNENDAPFILALLNTPSWKKFIGDRGVNTIDDARMFIKDRLMASYERFGFGFYLTAKKEGNIPIGICGMVKRDALDDVDLGFAFLPEYEGNGYGRESSLAMLDYAQEVHDLKQIAAIVNEDNQRSISLLEKLGFRFEKMILLPGENKEIRFYLKKFQS